MPSAADEVPWDIPVLPLHRGVRQSLYEAAMERAYRAGLVLSVRSGNVLGWADSQESEWFGRPAFRLWAATTAPLEPADLDALDARLADLGVAFAVLSAWRPLPPHPGFLDVGASVHALIEGRILQASAQDEDRVDVRSLGDVPEDWIARIVTSVTTARWYDRQSRDPRLNPDVVALRRTRWVETCLRRGDGFVAVALDSAGRPGHYVLVPFDRSREHAGGQAVGGLNGLLARLARSRWSARALLAAFPKIRPAAGSLIIQYQEENRIMSRLVEQCFIMRKCTRFDRHWHLGERSAT